MFATRPLVIAAAAVLAMPVLPEPAAAETDFDLVGRAAVGRLRALHFNKLPFDKDLSRGIMDEYLRELDFHRMYFLREDIDGFKSEFGDNLHLQLIDANGMEPATTIFRVYAQRAEERFAWLEEVIASADFDFESDQMVAKSREEADWPASPEEADELWMAHVESFFLEEHLRGLAATERAERLGRELPEPVSIEEVREKIQNRFTRVIENVRETDEEEIFNLFISSLCRVYDPHTDYFSFSEEQQFHSNMANQLVGIGALLQANDDGTTQIKGIVVNGPADKEGQLQLDDRVIAVDPDNSGELVDVVFMRLSRVVDMIRGEEGTEVRLRVIPVDDPTSTRDIVIKREQVELKDQLATAQLIKRETADGGTEKIGWITVPSFYANLEEGTTGVTRDVRRLLERLIKEGIDGLAIDLRMNGGGSLEEAISLTGLFIPRGPVVQAKDSNGRLQVRESSSRDMLYDGPLAVLVNKASASASEIFAGALQDYRRAVIIGDESTFGKGTVQTITPLGGALPLFADASRAGSLKVTISKFYRVAGGSTQLKGVVPDVVLPSRMDAMEIGEASQRNPLPFETIEAREFPAFAEDNLPLEALQALSEERIANHVEFDYIREDVARILEERERNQISLNLQERLNERAKRESQLSKRRAERRERFARILDDEDSAPVIYRIVMDNVDDPDLSQQEDFSVFGSDSMRRTLSEEEEAIRDENPEFPSGIDPAKEETLAVLSDLARLAARGGGSTVKAGN